MSMLPDDEKFDDDEDAFDLDDLDDEFDDEDLDSDLDDLDDEFDEDGEGSFPGSSPAHDSRPQERTFLQKYFNVIVIGFVGLLAVLWFLGQGGGGNNSDAPTPSAMPSDAVVAIEESTDAAIPVQPQPPTETEVPEPMRDMTAEVQDNRLPVPDTPLPPAPEAPGTGADIAGIEDMLLAEEQELQDQQQPDILTPLPVDDPLLYSDYDDTAAPAIEDIPVLLPEDSQDQEDVALPGFEKMASEDGLLDKPPEEPPAPATPPAALPEEALDALADDMKDELSVVKGDILALDQSISDRLTVTEERLSSLIETITGLEEKLDAVRKAIPKETPKPARPSMSAPQNVEKVPAVAVKQNTQSAPKSTPKKRTRTVSWELRSAQPGKAVVVRKGSNDFQTVEVGSNLPGIGKITSIGRENGQWVVRGTSGRITR